MASSEAEAWSIISAPRRTEEKQRKDDFQNSGIDDFEFETSKMFNFSQVVDVSDYPRRKVRGDSLPAMGFANGLFMPLKLPPRLQKDSFISKKSLVSSPKSPRTVLKNPFARKNVWKDDFDPFMVALEKVREEKRNSYHRRSMSQNSPFKVTSRSYNDIYLFHNQDNDNRTSHAKPTEVLKHSFSGPLDFKGSTYSRWTRDQIREGAFSQAKSPRGFFLGTRVGPAKGDQDCLEETGGTKDAKEKCEKVKKESVVRKMKGTLLKYASFGRESSVGKQTKVSTTERKAGYFSNLSLKFNGNRSASQKKKSMAANGKMFVVEYRAKPSFGLCFGYGVASPVKT